MRIIYFDICAIPLFLMILFVCRSRRMTKGNANFLFISLVTMSLISAIADLCMETADNMVPLSGAGVAVCTISAYVYLIVRNATNAVLLLFLLALTRTTLLIQNKLVKVVFCLPYMCILIMLAQNVFTHSAFTITAERGYARGPLMLAFYGVALIYGLVGLVYCIYCRRYLSADKWRALITVYVLVHLAVVIQFFHPEILVEMFCTAMAEMLIMLSVMRPEERMDSEVGMLSWTSYQSDLRNIILSGERVQIIVIVIENYREIRNYLGDHKYNEYIREIADGLREVRWNARQHIELYFENPGTIYFVTEADEQGGEGCDDSVLSKILDKINRHEEIGVHFEPRVCLIRCPDDLQKKEEIISLGHRFHKIINPDKIVARADEVVGSRTFNIEMHIGEILPRAIRDNNIEMYYQPIRDVRSDTTCSAEALARIIDPEYGLISPAVFIPAAEMMGLIVPFGDVVLEEVFRFVSEHDMQALGLDYIEINLSVAQLMERSLPDKIRELQEKYGVDPRNINLEITETTFENISEIMLDNVNQLIHMGYSFSLDDYGIGYSNIQRVNHIPLKLIKIDKSMLDEMSTETGRMILEYTVRMMQSIGKKIVAEGAETIEAVDALKRMSCDYIQGFYFSAPLPVDEFIRYTRVQSEQ